jgi:hypothetical protein
VILDGTLSGNVTFQGNPVSGATITIYDGKFGETDANGSYSIANVPYGTYILKGQKSMTDNGLVLSGQANVDIESSTATANLILDLPPACYRTVTIDGRVHCHYTWNAILTSKDESNDLDFHRELRVGPYGTHAEDAVELDVEDAHARLSFKIDWQLDNSVNFWFNLNLHDQNASNTQNVAMDATAVWSAHASAENDDANCSFTLVNARSMN